MPHIIGVAENIKQFQAEKCHYTVKDLINILKQVGVTIIVPHPDHATGIRGNPNISDADCSYVFQNADFVEACNYRYGWTKEIEELCLKYSNIQIIAGSDAHAARDVGAVYNRLKVADNEKIGLQGCQAEGYEERLVRGKIYWMIRRLKQTDAYQFVLKIIPKRWRRIIKNSLFQK